MSSISNGGNVNNPKVIVIGERDSLAERLISDLMKMSCDVTIVSNYNKDWKKSDLFKTDSKRIRLLGVRSAGKQICNYVVLIKLSENYFNKRKTFSNIKREIELAAFLSKENYAKSIFVFPYHLTSDVKEKISFLSKDINDSCKELATIVYLGQLVGKGVGDKEGLIADISKGADKLFPVNINQASKQIIKLLFSFGATKKSLAIISKGISRKKLIEDIKKVIPDYSLKGKIDKTYVLADAAHLVKTPMDIEEEISLLSSRIKKKKRLLKIKEGKDKSSSKKDYKRKKSRTRTYSILISILLLFVAASPFFLLIISTSSLIIAKNFVLNGDLSFAKSSVVVSNKAAQAAKYQVDIYSKVPLLGKPFQRIDNLTNIVFRTNQIAKTALDFSENALDLIGNVNSDNQYDLSFYSDSLSLDLDYLYKEIGFLQNEIESSPFATNMLLKQGIDKEDIGSMREKIYYGKKLVDELPQLLGNDNAASYLVLFQNNMELRPAGGFIGSFAIIDFQSGNLNNINVYDVYSADGQIKGYVEAPGPVNDYLSNAGWHLRDANWDPDFPESARTIEWFLEKEMNMNVDGVIGVDLEFVKKIIKIVEPIYLSDFDIQLNNENFYQITQSEVEDEFFPGSRKKAHFLSALASELIVEIKDIKAKDNFSFAKSLFDSLEGRHVQVYLHNNNAKRTLSEIGWDGGLPNVECRGNCYSDWFAIVEANFGVNKVNYHIQRSAQIATYLEEGFVRRELTLNIENTAPSDNNIFPWYKVYLRVLAPINSEFGPVEVIDNDGEALIEPEIVDVRGHREVGLFHEISPQEKAVFKYVWESYSDLVFDQKGAYSLIWRKQAGTVDDSVSVEIVGPNDIKVYSESEEALTSKNAYRYNTSLSRDLVSRIYW